MAKRERGPIPERGPSADSTPRPARGRIDPDGWLWGRHPVLAALANPARRGMGRVLATPERAAEMKAVIA